MKNIEKLKTTKINTKNVILFMSIFLSITIIILLLIDRISIFDSYIYDNIIKYMSPSITKYIKLVTKLGNATTIIVVCILLLILKRRYGIFITINVIVTILINLILKNIFVRNRPNILIIIKEGGYSFPSGHSMISIALYGYLFYLAYKKIDNRILKILVCLLLSIIIMLIGISRIYLGVHYASDVLAGYLVSVSILIIFILKTDRFIKY